MWTDVLRLLKDPHALHAAAVHLPIALGLLGVPLSLLIVLTRSKSHALKWVTLAAFGLCALGAGVAANAGEEAAERLGELTATEERSVSRHEELGENAWIWPLIPGAMVAVSLLARKHRPTTLVADVLACVASVGVAGWIGVTAHAGGELVYVQGIGVPQRGAAVMEATPGAAGARTPDASDRSRRDDDD